MITRDIYINSTQVTPPIRIVYGTNNLPVQFCMKDVELASGNTAKFYSLAPSENRYEQTGTINTTDQTITFTPEAGFFETGQNLLQCEITQSGKVIYSFVVDVLCGLNVMAEGTAAEAVNVKTWSERAEAAADTAVAIADSMGSAFPTATASGAVASFADGADGIPLKDMLVNITAVQAGSGDPSPQNVRAISGWTVANIIRAGKNLVSIDDQTVTTQTTVLNYMLFKAGTYTASFTAVNSGSITGYFRIATSNTTVKQITIPSGTNGRISESFTISEDMSLRVVCNGAVAGYSYDISNVQIELGSPVTEYESYVSETYTIQLGQTVYKGMLNPLTGEMVVTHKGVDLGDLSWAYVTANAYFRALITYAEEPVAGGLRDVICSCYKTFNGNGNNFYNSDKTCYAASTSINANIKWLCIRDSDYTDKDTFTEAVTGQIIVYPLAEPITIQLTPVVITTLLGKNNIWADCGDISVTYRADPTLYIDEQIAPIKAMVASEETGTTASQAYTAGQYFILDGAFCKALVNIASGATFTLGTNYSVTTIGAELYSALNL